MKYPSAANWLRSSRVKNSDCYRVKNILTDDVHILDEQSYHFLTELDGTKNPHELADKYNRDARVLLNYFDENMLTREGRTIAEDGMYLRTLFVPHSACRKTVLPVIFNFLLLLTFFPVLIWGLYALLDTNTYIGDEYMIAGSIVGILFGILCHEVAHAMSCLAYGGRCYEAGVAWLHYPAAYVMIDSDEIPKKLHRIQVSMAGIEMNLLLTGIFLLMIPISKECSGFFFAASMSNASLGVLNLAFVKGFDGSAVLREVLCLPEDIFDVKVLIKQLSKPNEVPMFIVCSVLLIFQLLLPIVVINNILIIMGGIL